MGLYEQLREEQGGYREFGSGQRVLEVQADSKFWQMMVKELLPRGGRVGWRWGCGVLARVAEQMGGPELRVINGFSE